jgi:hypothetical protein
MPDRTEFVALKDIQANGVCAVRAGDGVPAGVVDNLGLQVGVDVGPSGLALMPKPTRNARRAEWAAYALDQGAKAEAVDDLTRDQLIAEYDPDPEPEKSAKSSGKGQ